MTNEVENYLDEIIGELDFTSINNFLHEHMRVKMTFEELVAQISRNGLDSFNKENITTFVFDTVFYELSIVRPIFIKMIVFSLLFSIVHRLLATKNKYISDISFLIIYATLMVLLMQSFFFVREIALEGIDALLVFLNALIPTYAATLIFSGSAVTGAMLYELAFLIVYVVELVMKSFFSPLIQVFILILFLNHLFDEDKLSKMAQFIEMGIGVLLKASFGFVIGLGVVQSLISPAKDQLANNTVLSGISSIPGVGNIMGSAGEIVLSCGMLIKNSVGVIGLIILFFVALFSSVSFLFALCIFLFFLANPIIPKPITSEVISMCELFVRNTR